MRTRLMRGLCVLMACTTLLSACTYEAAQPRGTLPPDEVAAVPADAHRTASGLAYRVLARGSAGRRPGPNARVLVNYTGWTTDGTILEGAPIGDTARPIYLSEAMAGWREGLGLMSKGDKFRFWIPAHLAFAGVEGKPQGMVVYDVYLVDFTD